MQASVKKSFFLALIGLLLFSGAALSENLAYIPLDKPVPSTEQLMKYQHTIFLENRFALALLQDGQTPDNSIRLLESWKPQENYFLLYPLRDYNREALAIYGTILLESEQVVIYRTSIAELNTLEIFHPFQLVKLSDKAIIPTDYSLPVVESTFNYNPVIQAVVDSVSVDSIWATIGKLQTMERYTTNSQAQQTANQLKMYFENLGYDTVYFHNWQSGSIPNIIAEKRGMEFPDQVYIVGGHYDVYANGAPGADDNGSGSAAVMEMARVMAGINFKRTVKFILFSGEELGLLGSKAYAQQAAQQGENILGMINMDMIGYVAPGDPVDVDVVKNTDSQDLFNAYQTASQMYVPGLSIVNGSLPFGASSDHAAFWQNGFKAIFPFEDSDNYSPYIHSSQDVLGTSVNNQTLAKLGTQSVVAALASLAELAETRVRGHVYSAANLAPIPDAWVIFGNDSVQTDADGFYQTPVLSPGTISFSFKAAGYEIHQTNINLLQYQVSVYDAVLLPMGAQRPFIHMNSSIIDDDSSGASLGNNNGVADAGETLELFIEVKNVGNVASSDGQVVLTSSSAWVSILKDTASIPAVAPGEIQNSVEPFVVEINGDTPANTEVQFQLSFQYDGYTTSDELTLSIKNRGLFLIVQDDDNSGGLSAYTSALTNLNLSYDVSAPDIDVNEMMQYQNVIWFCGEDYSNTLTPSDTVKLKAYLDQGGRLFISGVDIGYDIHDEPFYSNYLKADYIGDGPSSTTTLVTGISNDPVSGSFTGGLQINDNYVDQINPLSGATTIFTYQAGSNTYNCGVRYLGDYQLVYLTFAFENISSAGDREQLMFNIANWFGLITGIKTNQMVADQFELHQNYPNPFNPTTTFRFTLPQKSKVELVVFDVLGRRVATVLNNTLDAGTYRQIWKAKAENGTPLPSGVYIYRLNARDFTAAKKLIILK